MANISWRIHKKEETSSTNDDARNGTHGDVYTALFQTAGRGRIGHRWLSPPGSNVIMSVVLSVEGVGPERVACLPIATGLAVARAIKQLAPNIPVSLKWPNDILSDRRKLAGILCERNGDSVIIGIGINVKRREFPPELAERAASLADFENFSASVEEVECAVLKEVAQIYVQWRNSGLETLMGEITKIDCLKGKRVNIKQTDDDNSPVSGLCGGISADGSLTVNASPVYAGEAHVESW